MKVGCPPALAPFPSLSSRAFLAGLTLRQSLTAGAGIASVVRRVRERDRERQRERDRERETERERERERDQETDR